MNSKKCCDILENHLCNSARRLFVSRRKVFQQDNDHKHTARQTSEWLSRYSVTALDWPLTVSQLESVRQLLEIVED